MATVRHGAAAASLWVPLLALLSACFLPAASAFQLNPAFSNDTVAVDECTETVLNIGPMWEQVLARSLQWFGIILSFVFIGYYLYSTWKATCGWEELYVCSVEFAKVIVELYYEYDPPAMIYQRNGQVTPWLRYAEWLLTCPVILIHLSNITGLNDDYSGRTMGLITSDLGGICMAVTSALSVGWIKGLFFFIGVCYGMNTFYNAMCIYIESYYTMPQGPCRNYVIYMAWVFFTSWFMFPGLFLMGPEGFGAITWSGTTIGHTVADLLSKNAWGMVGHFLRVKIHEHILLHGDVRRPVTAKALGMEFEVSCFVEEEEEEEDERTSTATYANRNSFVKMKENMENRGLTTRASMDARAPKLMDGSLVLAVADQGILQFFQDRFNELDATINVTPVQGMEQLQSVLAKGSFDGVLVAPDYLQAGVVQQVKDSFRTPVYAFGWTRTGPQRQMIESSGVDGWLEGPAIGASFNSEALSKAIGDMQQIKASFPVPMNSIMMGGGMMGGMHSMGQPNSPMVGAGGGQQNPAFGGMQSMEMQNQQMMNPQMQNQQMMNPQMMNQMQNPHMNHMLNMQQQQMGQMNGMGMNNGMGMQNGMGMGMQNGMMSPSGMHTPPGMQTPPSPGPGMPMNGGGMMNPQSNMNLMQQLHFMQNNGGQPQQ